MMVFKRKQIVILSLILMILVAGYLQYSYKKSSVSADSKDVGRIGDSVYVDGRDKTGTPQQSSSNNNKSSKTDSKSSSDQKAVSASKQVRDYFAQTKLDRDTERSKDIDALKTITQDNNADSASKKAAYDKMIKLIDNSEKETNMELLIKQKGFSDVITIYGEDGSLEVIVQAPTLTESQVAQITDIASRQLKVKINDIRVKNMF
ncbi:MAG: SpoIIIAH-like family protein [Bacillota bacterium]|nr:SpoIIIAH-like family protein [Bacillota bacterium]